MELTTEQLPKNIVDALHAGAAPLAVTEGGRVIGHVVGLERPQLLDLADLHSRLPTLPVSSVQLIREERDR